MCVYYAISLFDSNPFFVMHAVLLFVESNLTLCEYQKAVFVCAIKIKWVVHAVHECVQYTPAMTTGRLSFIHFCWVLTFCVQEEEKQEKPKKAKKEKPAAAKVGRHVSLT
jgi:hypothetical protein